MGTYTRSVTGSLQDSTTRQHNNCWIWHACTHKQTHTHMHVIPLSCMPIHATVPVMHPNGPLATHRRTDMLHRMSPHLILVQTGRHQPTHTRAHTPRNAGHARQPQHHAKQRAHVIPRTHPHYSHTHTTGILQSTVWDVPGSDR